MSRTVLNRDGAWSCMACDMGVKSTNCSVNVVFRYYQGALQTSANGRARQHFPQISNRGERMKREI